MLDTIAGVPIHPLIVHATVVLVPAAALAVAVAGLALVGSLLTTLPVVRIGRSGAEAAWSDVVDSTPAGVDAD